MRFLTTHSFSRYNKSSASEVVQGIFNAESEKDARKQAQKEILDILKPIKKIPPIYRLRCFKAYRLWEYERIELFGGE